MEQKILFLIVFLLISLFLFLYFQKSFPQLQASLLNSDFKNSRDLVSMFQEISQKLDKISSSIDNLNSILEKQLKTNSSLIPEAISTQKLQKENKIVSETTEETEIEKEILTKETNQEIKKEPKVSFSFPKGKEIFPNQEFEILLSGENFEEKSYDVKISVEQEGKVLSQIFNESEKKWQSSNYYLKNVFTTSSFSKVFKLKITSENIFGDVEILAKVREPETEKIVATTSEKIKIKQQIPETIQTKPQTSSQEIQKECIDINTASLEELEKLYGVGPTIAQRIIEARPFTSVDELTRVKGIGEKTLQKIKEQGLACIK